MLFCFCNLHVTTKLSVDGIPMFLLLQVMSLSSSELELAVETPNHTSPTAKQKVCVVMFRMFLLHVPPEQIVVERLFQHSRILENVLVFSSSSLLYSLVAPCTDLQIIVFSVQRWRGGCIGGQLGGQQFCVSDSHRARTVLVPLFCVCWCLFSCCFADSGITHKVQ